MLKRAKLNACQELKVKINKVDIDMMLTGHFQ